METHTLAGRPRLDHRDPLAICEADHRIANHLGMIASLVRQKAGGCGVDDHRDFLMDVAGRIDTVARLHRMLSRADGAGVALGPYLAGVADAMAGVAGGRLTLDIDCPQTATLPADTALTLGLIVAELISNAVKYAHPTGLPTAIRIAVADEGDALAFSFEDDGVGLPEGFDPQASDGTGLRVVRALADRIDGHCEWTDTGIGLRFACRFPKPRGRNGGS